jgi:V8-like Glu-specific endopeptidase
MAQERGDLSDLLSDYLNKGHEQTSAPMDGGVVDNGGDDYGDERFPEGRFIVKPLESYQARAIQGSADFEKVITLQWHEADANVSRKIGHFYMGRGMCTGFLVGPRLFLTNHHCVWNGSQGAVTPVENYQIYMDYLKDGSKGPVSAKVEKILKMDQPLDYALLLLDQPLGVRYGWLELDADNPPTAGSVKVIQHPRGRSKEIARNNSDIVKVADKVLHYMADTEGGSSGSPVFLKDGEKVVALHHVGTRRYNEGVLMRDIVPQIRQWLPKISDGGSNGGDLPDAPVAPDVPSETDHYSGEDSGVSGRDIEENIRDMFNQR